MTSTRRFVLILTAATLAAWATVSCVDTSTSTCAGGSRCRAGNLCIDQADGPVCVPAARVHDCADKDDGQPCRFDDTSSPAACRVGVCTLMECGNGYKDEPEVCDDGNLVEGDECSNDCERSCGDGMVQYEHGEICDVEVPLPESCLDRGFDMGTLVCADDCQDVSALSCTDFDWQPMPSVPDGWHFARVAVPSSGPPVAVGSRGVLPRSIESLLCTDCGGIFEYKGTSWHLSKTNIPLLGDLWVESPKDIYAVGARGNIWHFDGIDWTPMAVDPNYHLGAIWGTGTGSLFAVGTYWQSSMSWQSATFAILRYDGSAWIPMDLSQVPRDPSWSWTGLFGVWGSGPSDVFAVGSYNTILHYDGNIEGIWTRVDREPSLTTLYDVWGAHAENVIVVGGQGTMLHYDGQRWSPVNTPTQHDLMGIWGIPGGRIFAVGAGGTLLGHDPAVGPGWSLLASGTSSDLIGIHGNSADNILTVGINGTVLRLGEAGWTAMDLQGNQAAVHHLWGTGLDCIHAVDHSGQIWRYDGNQDWRWAATNPPGEWSAIGSIHGLACDQHVFAVGTRSLRYLDGTWTEMSMPEGAYISLRSVWVAGPDAVFAVGQGGVILHYDGNQELRWKQMHSGTDALLTGVWGTSASNVFAVGNRGTILHYDGNAAGTWEPMESGMNSMLSDVWGTGPDDVFAVGEGTSILHYDGMTWTFMATPTRTDALHVVWGSSASNVFAGSSSGALLHYDGTHWSPMRSPTESKIQSMWGTADGKHLLISDNFGRVFRLALPSPPNAPGN